MSQESLDPRILALIQQIQGQIEQLRSEVSGLRSEVVRECSEIVRECSRAAGRIDDRLLGLSLPPSWRERRGTRYDVTEERPPRSIFAQ